MGFLLKKLHLQYVTYDAAVSALQRGGGGGDGGMVRGVVLVVVVALASSRRLQCGAGRGAATGQTGGRRDPLWEKEEIMFSFFLFSCVCTCILLNGLCSSYCYYTSSNFLVFLHCVANVIFLHGFCVFIKLLKFKYKRYTDKQE